MLGSRLGETRRLRVCGPLNRRERGVGVRSGLGNRVFGVWRRLVVWLRLAARLTPETALAAHSKGVGQLIFFAALWAGARIVVGLEAAQRTDEGRDDCRAYGSTRPCRWPTR